MLLFLGECPCQFSPCLYPVKGSKSGQLHLFKTCKYKDLEYSYSEVTEFQSKLSGGLLKGGPRPDFVCLVLPKNPYQSIHFAYEVIYTKYVF